MYSASECDVRTAGQAHNVLYRVARNKISLQSGPKIWNLARRDEVTRDTSTQLDDFRPGMREPDGPPSVGAPERANSAMSLPVGRAGAGPILDHLGRFLAVGVAVAGTALTLDQEQDGGQESDEDAT